MFTIQRADSMSTDVHTADIALPLKCSFVLNRPALPNSVAQIFQTELGRVYVYCVLYAGSTQPHQVKGLAKCKDEHVL